MKEKIFSVTIKDCNVQTFRAGGKGGQNQNKVESGVRIIHPPSGATGESREHRTQLLNKRTAFKRMADHPKMKAYINQMVFYAGKTPEERVEEDMQPHLMRVEFRQEGEWKVQTFQDGRLGLTETRRLPED